MPDRYFSSQPITSDRIVFGGPEAHHVRNVMRAVPGDRVTLFDDSGAEFSATVEKLGRSEVELRISERHAVDRELPFPLVVGVALPKGDRQKWLVEKLTELGVTELVPLVTERGVAQPTAGALDRLHRAAIEAAKQCGRNRLMKIDKPQAWSEWLKTTPPSLACNSPQVSRILAHPGGSPIGALKTAVTGPTQLAVGPEGGFTDDEAAAATAVGWQCVSLGPRILRVETAAVALVAALSMGSVAAPKP